MAEPRALGTLEKDVDSLQINSSELPGPNSRTQSDIEDGRRTVAPRSPASSTSPVILPDSDFMDLTPTNNSPMETSPTPMPEPSLDKMERSDPIIDNGDNQESRQAALFKLVILQLEADELTFADWLGFVFDPRRASNEIKTLRGRHFWRHQKAVRQLLELWVHSHQTKISRGIIDDWAVDHVSTLVRAEANDITRSRELWSSNKTLGPDFLKTFGINEIKEKIQARCPTSVRVLLSMACADDLHVAFDQAPPSAQNIVLCCFVALLRQFNRLNNLIQVIFSLYMYAAGLKRQAFDVLAHLGILISYSLLVSGLGTQLSRRRRPTDQESSNVAPTQEPAAGPLKKLSDECKQTIKNLVKNNVPIGFMFDNINIVLKIAEPVLGRIDCPINGTCATAFEVHGATAEALDQNKARSSYLSAGPLLPKNILLSPQEKKFHKSLMVHNLLRILVSHGGNQFDRYMQALEETQPASNHVIELHQSRTHPFAAMEVDESSVEGTMQVIDKLYASSGIDPSIKKFRDQILLVAGDQKSIANLRAGRESRIGHDNPESSYEHITFIIGLLHTLMAAATGFLLLHFGQPGAGIHNPGSLWYHNRVLERKPIAIPGPVDFALAKNLIEISLIARVLHCFTLQAGCTSIDEYAAKIFALDEPLDQVLSQETVENCQKNSWERMYNDAQLVYETYASPHIVEELRMSRELGDIEGEGDMVYENALLFMRDALNMQELRLAVKHGDPGRVLLLLKIFALSFRGAGRTHYAHEMLHLIHNVETVWPPALRELVLNNWLINTTGHANSWIGLDHHQEHGNLWIKTIYKAHGSNASWSWLEVISPCVEAIRALAKDLNKVFGKYAGTHHTTPDRSLDINKLIRSLEQRKVYQLDRGRTFDGRDKPVPDAESVGFIGLLDGGSSALAEYNSWFRASQEARRRPIVSEMVSHESLPRHPPHVPQKAATTAQASEGDRRYQGAREELQSTQEDGTSNGEGTEELEELEELSQLAPDGNSETQTLVIDAGMEDIDLQEMFSGVEGNDLDDFE